MKRNFPIRVHDARALQALRVGSGLAAQDADRAADGSFVLVYGPGVRVRLFPLPGGAVVLEAHLAWLPAGIEDRSRLLASLLEFVSRRPPGEDAAWVPRPDSSRVVLQARVEEFDGVFDLQRRIDDFVQQACAWRSAFMQPFEGPVHASPSR